MSQAKWLQIGFFLYLVGEAKELFSSYPVQHSGLESHEMCNNYILVDIKIQNYNVECGLLFFQTSQGPLCPITPSRPIVQCIQLAKYTHTIRMYQEQINMIFYFINQEYLSKHFMIKTCVCVLFGLKRGQLVYIVKKDTDLEQYILK